MAISQVRAQFDGQWYTLTYNSETGRYEGQVLPSESSHSQSGGYYNITVEATNDTSQVSAIDGTSASALRLVVKEATAPVVTLVSPPAGYLNTNAPLIVFTVTDEVGGSGVDPSTISVLLDGTQAADPVLEAITNGYRVSCTLSDVEEGEHTITATASDYDGNPTELAVSYIIDTVPPALKLSLPNAHRIVDESEIAVAGSTSDLTTPPVTVDIKCNGKDQGGITISGAGLFSKAVPLSVGINDIVVTATDLSGQVSTETIRIYRMITDRTEADVEWVKTLAAKGWAAMTDTERAEWNSDMKGAYNSGDLNRVTAAAEYLNEMLTEEGYQTGYVPVYPATGRTEWLETDIVSESNAAGYLENVDRLRSIIPADVPETPPDMQLMDYEEANDIEKILVGIDAVHQYMEPSQWYSGEINCGEV